MDKQTGISFSHKKMEVLIYATNIILSEIKPGTKGYMLY